MNNFYKVAMPIQYELRHLFYLMNINASKFSPKRADFRCIFQQLITLFKRNIFQKNNFCVLQQRPKSLCIPECDKNAVFCQITFGWKLKESSFIEHSRAHLC